MDDQDVSPQAEAEGRTRKRLRTSHACDVCRSRKIRCDGNIPCASCAAGQQECTYGSEANSRGKSDLILEGVLRVERLLQNLNSNITLSPLGDRQTPFSPHGTSQPGQSETSTDKSHPRSHFYHNLANDTTENGSQHSNNGQSSLENAVLDSMHTSTTESVLQWPHFDVFPSLRGDYVPIFELEQSRPAVEMRPTSIMYPFVADEEVEAILGAFQNHVNFWYPTMSLRQLDKVRLMVKCFSAGVEQEFTVESCLAHLTIALGCASQVVAGLTSPTPSTPDDLNRRARRRETADLHFDHALRRLHSAHTSLSSLATQCLFFTATYFAFLRRPLQAWEYINAASAKCLLLLSYKSRTETPDDQERIRRIFWSCYILESDYLAELSVLPPSGISRIESSVPLPGGTSYATHAQAALEEQASLYLLACISMRRLLNRVHQLLYARGTGASSSPARFAQVVAELDHQLDEWRDVLPTTFAFAVDTGPTETEAGGFLRQRYLTCRSVIYRPYLMWMLNGRGEEDGADGSQLVLDGCRSCLEACLLHVLNLRGFAQTVLVDTWICSMSMAGAMLVLLAASRIPSLQGVLGPRVLAAGEHLRQLLTSWQRVAGEPSSPSVDQSVRVICEADGFIKQVFAAGDMLALYGQGGEGD